MPGFTDLATTALRPAPGKLVVDVSDPALTALLDQEAARMKPGQTLQAHVDVTQRGMELGVGARWKALSAEGYAARLWGGSGWTSGARFALGF